MAETPESSIAVSDRSLLRRLKAGENDAATALYMRYAGHLRSLAAAQSSPALAARVDADDIVQSVFRTFFRRANHDQYDVPEGDDLWKLFLVIALHKIRNAAIHHRAAKRDIRMTAPLLVEPARESADDASGLVLLKMVIEEALDRLPAATRRIIELRIEGHDIAEIAEIVARSKRSVERVLHEFRNELKGLLDERD